MKKILLLIEELFHHIVNFLCRIMPKPTPTPSRLIDCKIISHRGEHDNAAVLENTMAAFQKAEKYGLWGIEFDVRWTRDQVPVIFHDPDLKRMAGATLEIEKETYAIIKQAFPLIPTLFEVVNRFGGKLHLMIEIKKRTKGIHAQENRSLKDALSPLNAVGDYHLMSLSPDVLEAIHAVPKEAMLPIARFNIAKISRISREQGYGGITGHYLFIWKNLIQTHFKMGQKTGTGFVDSKNCLFRELNRGVEWVFSNRGSEMAQVIRDTLT